MERIINHFELLDLIAKGNTENLLQHTDLTYKLNALSAIGLVEICEGKIILTDKGKLVHRKRILIKYETSNVQKDMQEFSSSTRKRNSIYIYLSLLLLFTSGIFLCILLMQGI